MADMTDEEYDALDERRTETTPKVNFSRPGFLPANRKSPKEYNGELTEEEMDSILLPTPEKYREKYRQDLIEYIKNQDKMAAEKRTCVRVLIDTKTGEIRYEGRVRILCLVSSRIFSCSPEAA